MSTCLKPYPRTKDSSVATLGEVPQHWKILPLCAVATPKSITGQQHRELLSVYLDRGVIRFSDVEEKRTNVTSEDLSKYQAVEPGDFVLNNQQAWRGSVGVSCLSGIVSPAYLVLSLRQELMHSGFANLLLRDRAMVAQYLISSRGVGTIQRNLYWPHLKRAVFPLPSLNEQTAIARFLDHMDRLIQKYIHVKEKQIALLEEYKQALVHQAVTGQIDVRTGEPYPEYKESGVEWFGDVPIGWNSVALRHLGTKFGSGVTPRGGSAIYTNKGVAFLRSQNIHFDGLRLGSVARIPKEIHESLSGTHVKNDDVLLNITGASIGRVTWVPKGFEDANVNQHVCIIRPKKNRILPEFLAAFLSTPVVQNEIQVVQSGASREGLTLDSIRSIKVALPSVVLQKQIVGAVQRIRKKITNLTDSSMDEINLLNEYRMRLIADVVTGKFDVREAAAELPVTNAIACEEGVDTIQAASQLNRVQHGTEEEANA